jgi:transposase-like protein
LTKPNKVKTPPSYKAHRYPSEIILDILVQSHRNTKAAPKFLKKFLKGLEYGLRVIITLTEVPKAALHTLGAIEDRVV